MEILTQSSVNIILMLAVLVVMFFVLKSKKSE